MIPFQNYLISAFYKFLFPSPFLHLSLFLFLYLPLSLPPSLSMFHLRPSLSFSVVHLCPSLPVSVRLCPVSVRSQQSLTVSRPSGVHRRQRLAGHVIADQSGVCRYLSRLIVCVDTCSADRMTVSATLASFHLARGGASHCICTRAKPKWLGRVAMKRKRDVTYRGVWRRSILRPSRRCQ